AAHTLNGFPIVERVTGAPILAQSVAFLDCAVRDRLEAGHHTFFAGEVLDCGFLADEDTPILQMEDTRMNYGGYPAEPDTGQPDRCGHRHRGTAGVPWPSTARTRAQPCDTTGK